MNMDNKWKHHIKKIYDYVCDKESEEKQLKYIENYKNASSLMNDARVKLHDYISYLTSIIDSSNLTIKDQKDYIDYIKHVSCLVDEVKVLMQDYLCGKFTLDELNRVGVGSSSYNFHKIKNAIQE